jgi:hypothetical protein
VAATGRVQGSELLDGDRECGYKRRVVRRACIAALSLLAFAAPAAGARYESSSLTVTVKERKCGLTRRTVPAGPARIRVRNLSGRVAALVVAGRRVTLAPKRLRSLTLLLGTGSIGYRCSVKGRRVGRGTIRVALPPLTAHRIAVREAGSVQELYDRRTNLRFVPRGANYVRLAGVSLQDGTPFTGHSTFNVGSYDGAAAERALGRLHVSGYDTVRVVLSTECATGCAIDATTGRLSGAYFANVSDFLHRAEARGLVVVLTTGFLTGNNVYTRLIDSGASPQVQNINVNYLSRDGIQGNARFWQHVVRELRRFGAPTEAILGYDLRNELNLDERFPPFSLSSGSFVAPSGGTYDLASAADKARLLDDGLVYYVDNVRAAIRAVDPTALVAASFFAPHGPNAWRQGDPRIVRTQAVIERSAADYVDLHGSPGAALSLAQLMENFGVRGGERKPLVMGELGAFRSVFASADAGASALVEWQRDSCRLGLDGWLTWTWDTEEQPEVWSALSGGGAIERALAPALRPDPCA